MKFNDFDYGGASKYLKDAFDAYLLLLRQLTPDSLRRATTSSALMDMKIAFSALMKSFTSAEVVGLVETYLFAGLLSRVSGFRRVGCNRHYPG